MLTKLFSICLLLNGTSAFLPFQNNQLGRNRIISSSHFSTVNTVIKEKDLLIKSLEDLNIKVLDTPQIIKDYDGREVQSHITIEQNNGQNIGFISNGKTYELVADLQFWDQTVPVEVFLERITQRYSLNCVLESAEEKGFNTEYLKVNQDTGTIEIELSRYDY